MNGERVVVKVQRPFLKEIFDVDLKNIRVLAQILQAADPKSDGAARDWVAIYDECSRILYQVRWQRGRPPACFVIGMAMFIACTRCGGAVLFTHSYCSMSLLFSSSSAASGMCNPYACVTLLAMLIALICAGAALVVSHHGPA